MLSAVNEGGVNLQTLVMLGAVSVPSSGGEVVETVETSGFTPFVFFLAFGCKEWDMIRL